MRKGFVGWLFILPQDLDIPHAMSLVEFADCANILVLWLGNKVQELE